ncbi:hypothetical protein LDENG_00176420 [Lucifuga dentata]|nr:hypothetical protein LDENG_00176420 [Lucifuga dentata]
MEEDEEEIKYEIFPWALGRNWRKNFTNFLKQRDELWARIQYRAAVSRRCCEEVMGIVPSHFAWQRQRAEHHGGAQRQYGNQNHSYTPRGPCASPIPCALCNTGMTLGRGQRLSSTSRGFSVQTPKHTSPLPSTFSLSVQATPPGASRRKVAETKKRTQVSSSCNAKGVPSRCRSRLK